MEEKNPEAGSTIIYGNSYDDPDIYYKTGFLTSENVIYMQRNNRKILVTSSMERMRAEDESNVDKIITPKKLGINKKLKDLDGTQKKAKIIIHLLKREGAQNRLKVTEGFPVGIFRELTKELDVEVIRNPYSEERSIKSDGEIEKIKEAQCAAKSAISSVKKVLIDSEIVNNELHYEGSELTQGKLKKTVHHSLIERNHESRDIIVSSGKESSFPHKTGDEEKVIKPHVPIIVDVFPVGRKTRYCGDMTRTFVKGDVSKELGDIHRTIVEAQRRALDLLRPGIKASEIDNVVRNFIEEKGYHSNGETDSRKIKIKHSTGHGVGLEVHEKPPISKTGGCRLKAGNVVAIEPGLYGPKGGIRVEDIAVIKEDGAEIVETMDRSMKV